MKALERHRNILDFAISSLLRRKGKNLSLLVIYTLVVTLIASLIFFVQSLKREAALLLTEAPDIVVQRLMAGRHDLISLKEADKIREIRGVETVTPRRWGYYYDPVFGANFTVMADEKLVPEPGTTVVGLGVAKNLRVAAGDIFTLTAFDNSPILLTLKEALPFEAELLAADLLLIHPEDFYRLFGFPSDAATDLAVTVSNPKEQLTVATKIATTVPGSRPILKREILRTYDAIFDWRGGMMLLVLASALISFVIFAWDKATGLSAEERRETGILKSIGWETGDILLLKFWEGVAISLSAFLFGVILAYAHVFFLSAPLFAPVLKGWGVLYPSFRLKPFVDLYQISTLFFLTVLPYSAATILPSWVTATADADSALRS